MRGVASPWVGGRVVGEACLGLAAVVCVAATRAAAVPPGSAAATEALRHCNAVDRLPDADRDATLARGVAIAEAAVAADASDALGHFALVCLLGKRMERAGLSLWQLSDLRRLKGCLDRTLSLAPGDGDALMAKGALLLGLPRLLGGDATEAERLLREAVAAQPDNDEARCYLDEARRRRGGPDAPPVRPGC